MIRKTALVIALGTAAFGFGSVASAQYYENYDRSYSWNGEFPRGSWERTCRNASMRGPILRASCDNGHGRWVYTSIDVRGCPGERLRNTWGRLTCAARGYNDGYNGGYNGGRWRGDLPYGSWSQTCRGGQMRGAVLTATCDDGNHRWRTSSINMRQCYSGRVKNSWGRLICD